METDRIIYAYPVVRGRKIYIHSGFNFLDCAWIDEKLVAWAEVPAHSELVEICITALLTGEMPEPKYEYIGTCVHPVDKTAHHLYWK